MENENLNIYYSSIRAEYVKNQYDQCKIFDQSVFAISVGIFGLSFSFISQIVRNPILTTKWIMFLSWYYICISIGFSLVAYLINYYAYRFEINRIDQVVKSNDLSLMENTNYLSVIAQLVNISNLVFLLFGIICLLIYVIKNF
jgi:hypothetical protein